MCWQRQRSSTAIDLLYPTLQGRSWKVWCPQAAMTSCGALRCISGCEVSRWTVSGQCGTEWASCTHLERKGKKPVSFGGLVCWNITVLCAEKEVRVSRVNLGRDAFAIFSWRSWGLVDLANSGKAFRQCCNTVGDWFHPLNAQTCGTKTLKILPLSKNTLVQITHSVRASAATCSTGSPGFLYEAWKQAASVRKRGGVDKQDVPVMLARSERGLWSRCLIRSSSSAPRIAARCSGEEILPVSLASARVNRVTAISFRLSACVPSLFSGI